MLLIGFGNKARHGKDSAAQAITKYYAYRNDLWSKCLGVRSGGIRVGTFKFATALYQEVNEALKAGIWRHRQLGNGVVDTHFKPTIELPDWVQPEPNAEVSELAPYGKHPKLLQWWGTEFRRAQDVNYWVNKTFDSIPKDLDIALVTDVRFANEFYGIKDRGGYTIRVNRKNADGTMYVSPDRSPDHPSETALDTFKWDFEIYSPHGHTALAGEIAITIAEYLRGLNEQTQRATSAQD